MLPVILLIVLFLCLQLLVLFCCVAAGNDPYSTVSFRRGTGGISGALKKNMDIK